MFDFEKFYQIVTAEGFQLQDVPIAIRDTIAYTFGDSVRLADLRYSDGTSWVEGYQAPFVFSTAPHDNNTRYALCVTVSTGVVSKLGLIITTDDPAYTKYHALMESEGMRQAVATAFGYDDAIIITGDIGTARAYAGPGTSTSDYRAIGVVPTYSALYETDVNWRSVATEDKPAVADCLGTAFPGDDATKTSPYGMRFVSGSAIMRAVIPVELYLTDLQNVATINTVCDKIIQGKVASIISALADESTRAKFVEDAIMDSVEQLPVFGMSLIAAVTTATTMRQAQEYIPRP